MNMDIDTITLKNGCPMPRLGMGTWYLGEHPETWDEEMAALRAGIRGGCTLIDTAEMYGDGQAEKLVGEAIQPFDREKLFLVSKVLPENAGMKRIFTSLNGTLRRLGTEYLDLYLLHWRGSVPLSETVECMEELVEEGKIKAWGVSNFDTPDMEDLFSVPGGDRCAVNQVLYHLGSRGIEYDLLPWMDAHGVPAMAYCPLAQAGRLRRGLLSNMTVKRIAFRYHISEAQVLLAFVLHRRDMIAIPRSGQKEHVLENWDARHVRLSEEDWALLDQAFPAPREKEPLDIV